MHFSVTPYTNQMLNLWSIQTINFSNGLYPFVYIGQPSKMWKNNYYLLKSSDIPEWKSRGPYPLGSKANNKKHENNNNINTCLFTGTSFPNCLGHFFLSMASNSQVLCDNDKFLMVIKLIFEFQCFVLFLQLLHRSAR